MQNAESDQITKNKIDFLENEFYLKFMFGGKGKDDDFVQSYTRSLKKAVEKNKLLLEIEAKLIIAIKPVVNCKNEK